MGIDKMETDRRKDASTYSCWTEVSLRYNDTDAVGHINNGAFFTLLEQGRATAMFNGTLPLSEPGTMFVIASVKLDFLAEMNFPGIAKVGTVIKSFGRTSLTLNQAIFLDGTCRGVSEEVMVLIDLVSRKPIVITEETRKKIESRVMPALSNSDSK